MRNARSATRKNVVTDEGMLRKLALDTRRPQRGVTLPEILVVVAIIGLFAVIAIPSVSNYIRAARVRTSNDALISDLRSARYVAVTNHANATVAFDTTAGTWTYTDIAGKTVLRQIEPGVTMTATNIPITFKPDGGLATSQASIVLAGGVAEGVTYTFTITVYTFGKVTSTFVRS